MPRLLNVLILKPINPILLTRHLFTIQELAFRHSLRLQLIDRSYALR